MKTRLITINYEVTIGFLLEFQQNHHILRKILKNGPADIAGIIEGDRIIELNGENVESKSHRELSSLIQAKRGQQLLFLVVDIESDAYLKSKIKETLKDNVLNQDPDLKIQAKKILSRHQKKVFVIHI
jgi:C-terminal processing protease CtpA/Prc